MDVDELIRWHESKQKDAEERAEKTPFVEAHNAAEGEARAHEETIEFLKSVREMTGDAIGGTA